MAFYSPRNAEIKKSVAQLLEIQIFYMPTLNPGQHRFNTEPEHECRHPHKNTLRISAT